VSSTYVTETQGNWNTVTILFMIIKILVVTETLTFIRKLPSL